MTSSSGNSTWTLAILSVVLSVGGGATLVYLGLPNYQRATASATWPAVDGTVVSSHVAEARGRKRKINYYPVIVYKYEVDGASYENDDIWAGGGYRSTNYDTHKAVVDRYPAGGSTKVHYDPADPASSVLEPGVQTTDYLLLGLCAVLLVVGLGMGIGVARRIGRKIVPPAEEVMTLPQ